MDISHLLIRNGLRFPRKVALIDGPRRWTYRRFNREVNRLANGLREKGVGPAAAVGILLRNRLEFAVVFYALTKLGATLVPINYHLAAAEAAYVLRHSRAGSLIFEEEFGPLVSQLRRSGLRLPLLVGVGGRRMRGVLPYASLLGPADEPDGGFPPDAPHTLAYTSGTTGRPKGAVLTRANIFTINYLLSVIQWRLRPEDVFLVTTPLAHRIGTSRLVNSVSVGATLVLLRKFTLEGLFRSLARESVTVLNLIPTMVRRLMAAPAGRFRPVESVRTVLLTGEPSTSELERRVQDFFPAAEVVPYLSSTEGGIIASAEPGDRAHPLGSVGRPLPGVEVGVFSPQGASLPAGSVGEIRVRSGPPGAYSVMRGYLRDPKGTKEAFHDGWLCTGDLGRFDKGGYLYIAGRKKEMIISGGLNIYPREVELALESHPKVREAAVVATPHPDYGEVPKAFLVPRPGQRLDLGELVSDLRLRIAGYKIPKAFEVVSDLPRTASGKLNRRALRK
ncbi:MAG: acyl--CoA ligase [Candidatus Tectomicrobia bacterium]|nr:acyl--CoA ligase [Candidatus Tectomicrobia bacterium]